jgi:hypothetical protein
MNSGKRSIKVILSAVSVLGCIGVCAWFLYFNGNFDRALLSGTADAGNKTNIWAQPMSGGSKVITTTTQTNKEITTTAQDKTQLKPDEQNVDWHYIDPDSERAVKILLSQNAPGPNSFATLPLPAQYQPGQYNPLGPASISLATFQYFLKQGNSPALSEAATMYNACIKLYCDPAVALAFFQHESSMGRAGAAVENKSLGNIRCIEGSPCRAAAGNGSFKVYSTWTDGITDWAILIRETYATKWKLFSLEQILPRYAPSSDNNDPNGYINTVKRLVDKYRSFDKQRLLTPTPNN